MVSVSLPSCDDIAVVSVSTTSGLRMRGAGRRPRRVSPAPDDRVRLTSRAFDARKGTARKQARPLTADLIRQVVTDLVADLDPERLADVRDGALLLVGFAAALRRSELIALDVDDLEFVAGYVHGELAAGGGPDATHDEPSGGLMPGAGERARPHRLIATYASTKSTTPGVLRQQRSTASPTWNTVSASTMNPNHHVQPASPDHGYVHSFHSNRVLPAKPAARCLQPASGYEHGSQGEDQ